MAVIASVPIILKDTVFKVAADRYEAHVSAVEFQPATSIVKWKGLTPTALFTGVTTADWTCVISFAQDWTTTNSLSQYLLANEGNKVIVAFVPQTAAAGTVPTFTATVFITPGSIGGAVDSVGIASVTLPVIGKPVLTVALPPA